jgi:hypothetical protein
MIGNGQGETEIPLDHYLSWMTTNLSNALKIENEAALRATIAAIASSTT